MTAKKSYGDITSLKTGEKADNDIAGFLHGKHIYGKEVVHDRNSGTAPRPSSDIDWDSPEDDTKIRGLKGIRLIAELVRNLPGKPGVYRMLDENANVLYVGKARNLKKRVVSYTRPEKNSNRIARMICLTSAMEFIVTRSETEALLLEANLIKRLLPRFNVLLRDDKSLPYIIVTGNHPSPAIFKHRGTHTLKGDYFGPFASAGAVNRTINSLQRAFLLRTCTDSVFASRTRPCLLYQIRRCSAPCTNEISHGDYMCLVDEAKAFLSGKSRTIRDHMARAMHESAEMLDFERAAIYRDRLAALSHVQTHQGINPQTIDDADVIAVCQDGGLTSIQVFFFRAGQNWGNRVYFPKADSSLSAAEVLGPFLAQFYNNKPVPRLILVSHEIEEHELLAQALGLKAGSRVQILRPQRGEKKKLVWHALNNARESLGRRLAETSSQAALLEGFASVFALPAVPQRIEVYDNSHIMGANAVGGMIVAGTEGFVKNQYRKFNIRSADISPGDDYGMMREVMERRFSRLLREHSLPEHSAEMDRETFMLPAWPDVILVDGGQGQVQAVCEVLEKMGIIHFLTVIGVAKGPDRDAGRERFFVRGKLPFALPPRDPILYFIQRLRDEAHRFAIGSHRSRRKKAMTRNPLDEIGGIGPKRKRELLGYFGTAKAISSAAVEDLMQVKGISQSIAQSIYDYFNER